MASEKLVSSIEDKLWAAADKLRGSIDASKYKNIVLGIIFLKYISDRFEKRYQELIAEGDGFENDRDEYERFNVFYVPEKARWEFIVQNATKPSIGQIIDEAFIAIEKENKNLAGVLPKIYSGTDIDQRRVGEVVLVFENADTSLIEEDALGRVYEYFLGKFAFMLGAGGGEYYTPSGVVKLLVEMIEPFEGTIYDPCCGSGGMFVQANKFVKAHGGNSFELSIYGQELNAETRRLATMNLAIRGIEANLGQTHEDTFHADQFKDEKFDYILANPPFNISDWGQESLVSDLRWKWGVPTKNNANYAWLSHMLSKLKPSKGVAGIVLANGSLSSQVTGEGNIRSQFIDEDLVDCIVALPDKLFYTTGISVCLWFLRRGKKRRNEVLFIDARDLGDMVDRKLRELTDENISVIASTYHKWLENDGFQDVVGFCKSASTSEIQKHEYVLTPGRYVGVKEITDEEPFAEKMPKLVAELSNLMKNSSLLDEKIKKSLGAIGYEF
ncbi:type I restriction-modification system subunit M [Alicyclobacillus fastidiosus]|uniref:site-specific DNA-methyltransferase (adenine-specific) n=1 Tax=Alicyclobacillus fastidiosus TaxID=392011 RepID=A0ABY6ZPE1_9BACL|nr:class I SAM-dependent DNA methyltransferase [Alicyclobacillus fastidiosus]WAH44016.1 type I restriction-modification system subunit M [Alicyclobacillus fastidiosus]GMA60300.1 DNA methyltransferase [Alicyclobacillus fastidiosus]